MTGNEMNRSWIGRLVEPLYRAKPVRPFLLWLAVRAEGGEMKSLTLRRILSRYHRVEVGPFSYGSLLIPGHANPATSIGAFVSVGPNVRRFGADHPTARLSMHPFGYNPALGLVGTELDVPRTSCRIEHDVWLGANVSILSGCSRIGVGAVVAANAVVTADVPDFTIVGGIPARKIGERLTESERAQVLAVDFDNLPAEGIPELNSAQASVGVVPPQ